MLKTLDKIEKQKNDSPPNGFTLIELSIVLVIIGLIIGGVLIGRDLIRSSELRSVISQYQSIQSAVQTFKTKYNCIPGDCADATSIWGQKANCDDRTEYSLTCNGNGNGRLAPTNSSAGSGNEFFLFWQHLANANLVAGKFNGVEGTLSVAPFSGYYMLRDPNVNAPIGKISNTSWGLFLEFDNSAGGNNFFTKSFPISLTFGGVDSTVTSLFTLKYSPALFTPSEMYNIDTKIDDGKPASGSFGTILWTTTGGYSITNCTTAAGGTILTADYILSNTVPACNPFFFNPF